MSDTTASSGSLIRANTIEDRFWGRMGMLMAVLAVVGFAPNSVAILAGTKDNPPLIVHLHAAVMFTWVALLATQANLVSLGRINLHQRLGRTAFVLGPIIILMLAWLSVAFHQAGPFEDAVIALQGRRVVLFTTFFIWAVRARASDATSHKRMMFFATLVVMDAATNRMNWLPQFGFSIPVQAGQVYLIALFIPFFVHDLRSLGRIHVTTLTATSLMLVSSLAVVILLL